MQETKMSDSEKNRDIQQNTKDVCYECGRPITPSNQSSFIKLDMEGEHRLCAQCGKIQCGGLLVFDY